MIFYEMLVLPTISIISVSVVVIHHIKSQFGINLDRIHHDYWRSKFDW